MMVFEWTLGNQDSSQFGPQGYWLQYFFYMLACLTLIIIMLNLLISIIGESNTRVTDISQQSMYMEFVNLIIENWHLVDQKAITEDHIGHGKYLATTELQNIMIT